MPQINELLVLHHTHTDIGYTHPQPMLLELQKRFIDQSLDLAERTLDWDEPSRFRWTCEVTYPLVQWLQQADDRRIQRFRDLVKAGSIGAAALPFHPTPMIAAPQAARLLQPIHQLRQTLGLPMRAAIGHDINGLPWPLNPMLRQAGVQLLIMGINIVFGGFPLTRPLAFRWIGPDDGELLAFNGEHYAAFNRELKVYDGSIDVMAKGLSAYLKRAIPDGWPHDWVYMTATHPYFVDNNGPDIITAKLVHQWNAEQRTPRIRYILPEDLLARLQADRDKLPAYAGDWTDYWNFGAASSAQETAVNRRTKHRMTIVDALATRFGDARPDAPALRAMACENLDLYDEHTWGANDSTGRPDRDNVREQWSHKAHYAWNARSFMLTCLTDHLEHAAGNPLEGEFAQGVMFVNTTDTPRSIVTRIPRAWLAGDKPEQMKGVTEEGRAKDSLRYLWHHFPSAVHRYRVDEDKFDDSNSRWVGPVDVPANTIVRHPLGDLTLAQTPDAVAAHENAIESSFYRIAFNPADGRVTSVIDKRTGLDLVPPASQDTADYSFFGYVNETVDPDAIDPDDRYNGRGLLQNFDWEILHRNLAGWRSDWPARRTGPTRLRSLDARAEPFGAILTLNYDAPGVRNLTQRIILPVDRPAVILQASLDKLDIQSPDSIYFTIPTALNANWRAHYQTAGLPVEFDAQQLPGVARDFVTVDDWLCMHDADLALTVACPDAPLVQLGDFHFGKKQASVDRPHNPLLLLWACNNYWMTNFRASQPGPVHLRWELTSDVMYNPARATRFALAAARPVEIHPLLECDQPAAESIITLDSQHLALLHMHPHPTEPGVTIAWLANPADQTCEATLTMPDLTAAQWADTLLHPTDAIPIADATAAFSLPAQTIRALRLHRKS